MIKINGELKESTIYQPDEGAGAHTAVYYAVL